MQCATINDNAALPLQRRQHCATATTIDTTTTTTTNTALVVFTREQQCGARQAATTRWQWRRRRWKLSDLQNLPPQRPELRNPICSKQRDQDWPIFTIKADL